jgi:hypothetical protein
MAILNITYGGRSADLPYPIDDASDDADVKRVAAEVLRGGGVPGLRGHELTAGAFRHFVIDRITDRDGVLRFYLRPKVPFGQ